MPSYSLLATLLVFFFRSTGKTLSHYLPTYIVSWLMHMLEGSPLDIEDDESSKNCAARWVNISNRGGLFRLSWSILALLRC